MKKSEVLKPMIKSTVSIIESIVDRSEGDEVADKVREALSAIPRLYSVYEYNPNKKGAFKWQEVSCSHLPEDAQSVAEALSRDHKGQIEVRYEAEGNVVLEVVYSDGLVGSKEVK